jgi:hypothetical protein
MLVVLGKALIATAAAVAVAHPAAVHTAPSQAHPAPAAVAGPLKQGPFDPPGGGDGPGGSYRCGEDSPGNGNCSGDNYTPPPAPDDH